MSEEILTAEGNLNELARLRDEQAQRETAFEAERKRWHLALGQAETELAAAKALIEGMQRAAPQKQLYNVFDALTELVNDWNNLADDGDRGRDNAALLFVLWDDGSGRLGTTHGPDSDTGPFSTYMMNIHEGWNDIDGLVAYLMQWVKGSEAFRESGLK